MSDEQGTEPGNAPRLYDHHRLDVYNAAVAFLRWRRGALRQLPKTSNLADQLTRAATSVVLNIAEAAGEFSPRDRARFYRFARRSATECDGALDAAEALEVESPRKLAEGRVLITRIIAMLTILVRGGSTR